MTEEDRARGRAGEAAQRLARGPDGQNRRPARRHHRETGSSRSRSPRRGRRRGEHATGSEPILGQLPCTVRFAVEQTHADGEDLVEAAIAQVELLELRDDEVRLPGVDVGRVTANGRLDHLGRAVDPREVPPTRRSQTKVAATPWPHPISRTRSSGWMSSPSTTAPERSLMGTMSHALGCANIRSCPTPSCTATPPTRSSTAPRTRWSWPRRRRSRSWSLALTDHDGLHGAMEMAQALKLLGGRPITGAELTSTTATILTLLCQSRRLHQPLPPDHGRPAHAALGARGVVGAGRAGHGRAPARAGPARHRPVRHAGGRRASPRPRLPVRLRPRRRRGRSHRAGRVPGGRGGRSPPAGRLRPRPLSHRAAAPYWRHDRRRNKLLAELAERLGCPASPPATCTCTRASAPRSRTPWSRFGWAPRSTRPSPGAAATPPTC